MIVVKASAVSEGIAIGKIRILKKKEIEISTLRVEDAEAEIRRYQDASQKVQESLEELYEQALLATNAQSAEIFSSYQMLASDVTFADAVEEKIRSHSRNAEAAVTMVRDEFKTMFEMMEDPYMRARAADIVDVSNRLICVLSGVEKEDKVFDNDSNERWVLLADDLTPGEFIQMDKKYLEAIVLKFGSIHSHTSILARTMHIPMMVGVAFPEDCEGQLTIMDGEQGMLYIDPDNDMLVCMQERKMENSRCEEGLNRLRGQEDQTPEGKKIQLYANAGSVADVLAALNHDASGIGLFRTEFLFLEHETEPTEEEQFQIYRHVVELMAGKKVIFRTTDIGSDKPVKYMDRQPEVNPSMGYRGIRISLDDPKSLKCQLRALYRASAYGQVSIMYPMVVSVAEVEKLKAISAEVRQELMMENILIGDVEEGIMIETPAAALISDRLAKIVDFFSIGTNDLAAFTLAMDRVNNKLTSHFDPNHEAILRLIQMTIENGHKAGIWVGICGEMAADLKWTKPFIEMGMDEFSVSPSMILPMRQKIRE